MISRRRTLGMLLAGALAPRGSGAGIPKPVPAMQALPVPEGQVVFQREGAELARCYYGAELKRPFVYPVNGPSGRSLTRMGHPRDPETHSHHNSVWIAHQNVGGVNFWEDRLGPKIAHQRVLRFDDGDDEALAETENAWVNGETKLLRELRRTSVQPLPNGEWMLLLDLQLEAVQPEVVLGQTAFGMIGVRMAKTIGVTDGGGTIRNSEGGVDEAGCLRLPARWCDYAGPIAPGVSEGIALMDHPENPGHPVPFHVRNDGWMGAALTFAGALSIVPERPLRLRYALYVHGGLPEAPVLQARWEAFARTAWRPFPEKKRAKV